MVLKKSKPLALILKPQTPNPKRRACARGQRNAMVLKSQRTSSEQAVLQKVVELDHSLAKLSDQIVRQVDKIL